MKTAPAAYTTSIAANSSDPVLLVEIVLSTVLRIADRDITPSGGSAYDGRLMNALSLSLKMSRDRGGGQIGDITIQINNLDDWFSSYKNEIWGNATVRAYQTFVGAALSDRLLLYTGKIKSNFRLSDTLVELAVQEDDTPKIDIPSTLVSRSDFPGVPEENEGKPVPIIYGDNSWNYCDLIASLTTFDKSQSLVKGIDGGVKYGKRQIIVGDGLDASSITNVWAYDTQLSRMVRVSSYTFTTVNGIGVVEIDIDPKLYDFVFGDGTVSSQIDNSPLGTVTNAVNSCDKNNANYAVLYAEDVLSGGAGYSGFTIDFDTYEPGLDDADISAITAYARTKLTTTGTINTDRDLKVGGYSVEFNPDNYYTELLTMLKVGASATAAAVSDGIVCLLNGASAVATLGYHTAWIYEVFKRVSYKRGKLLDIYIEGSGRDYGAWISSRPGHPDTALSGSTIENHAGIIESLFRDEAGITPHTASFDTVATELDTDGIVGNLVIDERLTVYEAINKLCKINGISFVFDESGYPKVSRYKTGKASVKSFTTANIIRGTLKVFKIDINDVSNRLSMEYFRNPITGQLKKEDISFDAASEIDFGTLNRPIKNYSTKDDASAGAQNDLLVSLFKDQDWGVTFETNLQGTILDRGDIIDVTHNAGGLGWSVKKFEVMEVFMRGRRVRIVAHEYV